MNPQRDDPIIDACLEEVLGGIGPPDHTEQVLRALEEGRVPTTYPHLMPAEPEYEYEGNDAPVDLPDEVAAAGVVAFIGARSDDNESSDRRVAAASVMVGAAATAAATTMAATAMATTPRRAPLSRPVRNLLWGVSAASVIAVVGFWVGRNSL